MSDLFHSRYDSFGSYELFHDIVYDIKYLGVKIFLVPYRSPRCVPYHVYHPLQLQPADATSIIIPLSTFQRERTGTVTS